MSANRKLQTEIQQVLKKVQEGVLDFDSIWEKVYAAGEQSLKEKYEGELKKEIKKLQRLRDQIKTWLGSNEIKDKVALTEARKVIEGKMEQFKVCEKDTKTKAYSKEGLAREARMDPKEAEKEEKRVWLNECLEKLSDFIDSVEADIEKIPGGKKAKNKEQIERLESRIKKNRWHIDKLEQVLKLMENDDLDPRLIDDVKDDVEYYIDTEAGVPDEGESGVESEFDIYEGLQLDTFTSSIDRLAAENDPASPDYIAPLSSAEGGGGGGGGGGSAAEDQSGEGDAAKANALKKAILPVTAAIAAAAGVPAIGKPVIAAPKAVPATSSAPSALAGAKPLAAKATLVAGATITSASSTPTTTSKALAASAVPSNGVGAAVVGAQTAASKVATAPTAAAALAQAKGDKKAAIPALSGASAKPDDVKVEATPVSATSWAHAATQRPAAGPPAKAPTSSPNLSSLSPVSSFGSANAALPSTTALPMSLVAQQAAQGTRGGAAVVAGAAGSASLNGGTVLLSTGLGLQQPSQQLQQHQQLQQQQLQLLQQQQRPVAAANAAAVAAPQIAVPASFQGQNSVAGQQVGGPSMLGLSPSLGGGGAASSGPNFPPPNAASATLASNLSIGSLLPQRSAPPIPQEVLLQAHMLKQSMLNSPESAEADRQSGYVPRNPYNTHASYPVQPPSTLENAALFERLPPDSLFFAFYYQQNTYQQYLAAKQLKKHSWRFHKKYMTWFQRHEEPKIATDDFEEGTYVYFDYESGWCQRIKSEFKFEFAFLEDELSVAPHTSLS